MRPHAPAFLSLVAAASLALAGCGQALAAENYVRAPVAATKAKESGLKTAIFAGGCFWGVEAVFSHVKGVKSAVTGYHGGTKRQASYNIVSSGVTDHVEAVKITYDPAQIRYDQLLRIFFSVVADPTLRNRQGPDSGSQYNAELVPTSAEQRRVAQAYLAQMKRSGVWDRPIVTAIAPAKTFYPAETYHQNYALKNPRSGYIVRWDAPKVAALKQFYPGVYRASFLKD